VTLYGRAEVERRKQRLKALFGAVSGIDIGPELLSHYSRYLCILVSGFAEQSVKELTAQYCRKRSPVPVQRYVGAQLKRLRNIDLDRLRELVQSFNVDWWSEVEANRADEIQAFGSISTVRNSVSHGGDSGITMSNVRQYFDQICVVLDDLCDKFDPC
jgi:hypothetical protein